MMQSQNKSSAKVVDGKLILSLLGARKPILWQMDLSDAKASALEIESIDKSFVLRLKTAKGETLDIAPFENQESAMKALKAASKALESAQGQIRPANHEAANQSVPVQKSGQRNWFLKLVMVVFMFAGILFIGSLALTFLNSGSVQSRAVPPSSIQPAPQSQIGVPMSADDFLRAR